MNFQGFFFRTSARIFCIACTLLATIDRAFSATQSSYFRGSSQAFIGLQPLPSIEKSPLSQKWLHLVHYKITEEGEFHGEADGMEFYLSPRGRKSPEEEWNATLKGFQKAIPQPPRSKLDAKELESLTQKLDEHARCLFPARFRYLSSIYPELKKLPSIACPSFENFRRSLSARGASLIFSSYYLNNPSSAFGHTFLRLKHAPERPDTERAELLDYGINYAAVADTSNAFLYGLYGLVGFFPGTFTKLPYYYKVREYNDFESRDIWVYDLNLTQAQVDELVEHLWELGHTYFDYYFLSKNCSYHLLRVLDAVNPDWRLADKIPFYVIPSESVRAIQKTPGLVQGISFRPSMRRQFTERLKSLSSKQTDALEKVIETESSQSLPSDLNDEDRLHVLDAAIDYFDYRYADAILRGNAAKLALKQKFLVARSELQKPSEERVFKIPSREAPDAGHNIRRAHVSGGVQDHLGTYSDFGIRAAFHDLLDLPDGYPTSAEMSVFDLNLRYFFNDKRMQLQNFSLVQITSLSPVLRFSLPISWRFKVGLDRIQDLHCDGCLATGVHLGGGLSKGFWTDRLIVFSLLEAQVLYSPEFFEQETRYGVGPVVGARTLLGEKLIGLLEAHWNYTPGFNVRWSFDLSGELRVSLGADHAIGVSTHQYPVGWDSKALYFVYF